MSKIYFIRHQAAGIVTKDGAPLAFGQPPTEAQFSAVERECFLTHGDRHKKTGEFYWTKVVEVDVLGPDDVIEVQERSLSVANVASTSELTISGSATVTDPNS